MLRVDGSWPFSFCISDKKSYGALLMGFWLLESILSYIYLLMFSSEFPFFFFIIFYLLIHFSMCDSWHVQGQVSCPVQHPCEYQMSISDKFQAVVTENSLHVAVSLFRPLLGWPLPPWSFCQALLYIRIEWARECHQTWCLLTLGFYFNLKFLFYLSWLARMLLSYVYRFLFHGTESTRSIQLCLFSPTWD